MRELKPTVPVEVYKNGTLVGSRGVTAWPYYANGGKIGMWMFHAGGTVLDDFGGGTSVNSAYGISASVAATNAISVISENEGRVSMMMAA